MGDDILYIIGNGFDLAHGMPTRYRDFRRWLVDNNRIDVIQELQSAYPTVEGEDYLLWADFETALGQYDIDMVINWSWENSFLTEYSIGGQRFESPSFFLDIQLNDIINNVFSEWARQIPIAEKAVKEVPNEALYLTFNYTDTLEVLYHIPETQICHIHGRASVDEYVIVGHSREINPADYWDDNIDMRENNERMQRLVNMNELCKPYNEIIERNDDFFKAMQTVKDVYVDGHSCGEIDYPYFWKVKESVSEYTLWHFNPHSDEDVRRIVKLKEEMGIL